MCSRCKQQIVINTYAFTIILQTHVVPWFFAGGKADSNGKIPGLKVPRVTKLPQTHVPVNHTRASSNHTHAPGASAKPKDGSQKVGL